MDRLWQDLAFALRALRRRPVRALVPTLTLAIGIGAATAVFSVFDAVLLEPPPYREPDRLVLVWHRMMAVGGQRARVAGPDVVAYERDAAVFEGLAFVAGTDDLALETSDGPTHVRVGVATSNLFRVLGVDAVAGRVFAPDEAVVAPGDADPGTAGPPIPLILGHAMWSSRFGADEGVIGRIVRLGGIPMRIVGVLPADFELLLPPGTGLPDEIDAWRPLITPLADFQRPEGLRDQDSDNTGAVIGRLRSGVSLALAREGAALVASRQRQSVPEYREVDLHVEVVPLTDDATRHARPLLLALMGAVTLVLLIACTNVANLLLARALERGDEMAVRSAVGAGRGRLARQALTEAALLGLSGAGLGILVAAWGIDALLALRPEGLLGTHEVGIDGSVLGFAIAAGVVSTLLFGCAPAAAVSRDPASALRASGPRGGGQRRRALRRGLVISEVALSFTLLVGAVLMLRTTANLQSVDPGFDPDGLLTFQVALPPGAGGPADRARFIDSFERRLRELPGVDAVGTVGGLPLGDVVFRQPYGPGRSSPETWGANAANFRVITAEYFEAMGTRLLAGRVFTPAENVTEDERVAVVDAKLAGRIAPGESAVGRTIGFPLDGRPTYATIVGVVEDVRFEDLRRPGPETIYVPYRQEASRTVGMAVRARGAPAALVPTVREIARRESDAMPVPVYGFRDMESYVSRALAPTRFVQKLLATFGALAVGLAGVGLFGVVSYGVGRRTREFGIRIALGAPARRILLGILGSGLGLAAVGVVIGAALALASASAARALFFGVGYADPLTYAFVAAVLLAATALASWAPARRAASVDPVAALEHE